MEKRRNYVVIPLALLFFAILGLNIWVFKSIGRTNTVIDKTVIEHRQLEFFVPGKRILIQASILDPAGVAEARLYFSASKDIKNLAFSKMKLQGDNYAGVIPTPSSETEKIFYSILAVNYNGDVVKTGLFELQVNKNIGFVPTWQGDFNEYGETLILGKEDTSGTLSTVIAEPSSPVIASPSSPVIASEAKQSHGLEGFSDSIIVNIVKPDERYFAAKKVRRVAGLSTIDGGETETAPGEEKKGWTKEQKIAAGAGAAALAIGGGIAAASGGGGGGDGGETNCTDEIDNDGDGDIDCEDSDCPAVDGDGDGVSCKTDCDDNDPNNYPGNIENCSDGQDNDCDGFVDCADSDCPKDADGDGVLAPPCGNDCDDNDPNNFPGNAENCNDDQDNDCDGLVDCADPDCPKDADGDGVLAPPCGNDCDDNDPDNYPGNEEDCDDNKDNDCDGFVDGNDPDCVVENPDQSVDDGAINFEPNIGVVGDPVSATICLDEKQDLGSGWHIRVFVDGSKIYEGEICTTTGPCALTCDLGQIFKFSDTNHTVRVRINWETGAATLFEGPLPLESKD